MRLKFAAEQFKDRYFGNRNKRWSFVSQLLDDPRRGAELGVKGGRFSANILQAHENLHLFAVDLWGLPCDIQSIPPGPEVVYDENLAFMKEFESRIEPYASRVTPMQMPTTFAAPLIEDESLDFIFIDANHTYDGVAVDIDDWVPKVRPGGWITGHDYSNKFPGVVQAVLERFEPEQIELGPDTVWAVKKF